MKKIINLFVQLVSQPFGNLRYRDETVLVLGTDKNGNYLLGSKRGFYPKGIVRFVGGGVHKGESVINATIRELKEELGIFIPPTRLTELIQVHIKGEYNKKVYRTKIYIYFCTITTEEYVARDDIDEVVSYSESDYLNLIKQYYALKDDDIYNNNGCPFSWGDYGRVYGFIHQVALDEFKAKKLQR